MQRNFPTHCFFSSLLKIFFLGVVFCGFVFPALFFAQTSVDPSLKNRSITIAWEEPISPIFAPFFLALGQDIFKKNNLEVKIVQNLPYRVMEAVVNNKISMGFTSAENLLTTQSLGFRVVAFAQASFFSDLVLGVKNTSKINRPKDLEGKKIALRGTKVEQKIIQEMVKADGGDFENLSFLFFSGYAPIDLQKQEWDAIFLHEGWEKIVLAEKGVELRSIKVKDFLPFNPPSSLLVAKKEWLVKNKPLVQDLLASLQHAFQLSAEKPERSMDSFLEKQPDFSRTAVWKSFQYYQALSGGLADYGYVDAKNLADYGKWLKNQKLLVEDLPIEETFTNSFFQNKRLSNGSSSP